MHSNAELVRRGYAAFNTGDVETLKGLFEETASWHSPGRSSLAGKHAGIEDVFRYFGRLAQGTEGTFRADLRHVTADDDSRVVAIQHNTGTRNGKRLAVDCCVVFHIENGRVVEGKEHFHDLYAWDEFWS